MFGIVYTVLNVALYSLFGVLGVRCTVWSQCHVYCCVAFTILSVMHRPLTVHGCTGKNDIVWGCGFILCRARAQ